MCGQAPCKEADFFGRNVKRSRSRAALQNVTGEIEERPNRTKTTPKQTEKRGKWAGKNGITENCHRE